MLIDGCALSRTEWCSFNTVENPTPTAQETICAKKMGFVLHVQQPSIASAWLVFISVV